MTNDKPLGSIIYVHESNENSSATYGCEKSIWQLIGGEPTLTMRQLAQKATVTLKQAERFWLVSGFPKVNPDLPLFTVSDLQALHSWYSAIESGQIVGKTVVALQRAHSHMNDRLVLWQFEALVDEFQERFGLDYRAARIVALEEIDKFLPLLEQQVMYSWRRQMAGLLENTAREVAMSEREDPTSASRNSSYPLERCMGFVDMVAYTRRSSMMNATALTDLVEQFDAICRDVISSRGGRVVKTIGDAVLWVSSSLEESADIACALMEELQVADGMLPVRSSLVHGWIVSRSGDIFGTPVNLASRLVDEAPPGTIYMDKDTAVLIYERLGVSKYSVRPSKTAELHGLGPVEAWTLSRADNIDHSGL